MVWYGTAATMDRVVIVVVVDSCNQKKRGEGYDITRMQSALTYIHTWSMQVKSRLSMYGCDVNAECPFLLYL